jgi:sugar phosphate isomerase/epimerase
MQNLARRQFIATLAMLGTARRLFADAGAARSRFGLCTFSCHQLWAAIRQQETPPFTDAVGFFKYGRTLGGDGVQTPLRRDDRQTAQHQAEQLAEMLREPNSYYEAEVQLPETPDKVPDFERQVALARQAGATVARTVLLRGRRYEVFSSREPIAQAIAAAREALGRSEPILRQYQLKLAIENHKDLTLEELIDLIRDCGSPWIGVLVDTGNSMALLEDPDEVVDQLAPYAMSVHFKDMAVKRYADGILLSEVPLGSGCLDLPRMIAVLKAANPSIVFNLEMATRDPLRVPCLLDTYWGSFEPQRRGQRLDRALSYVDAHPPQSDLPSIAGKTLAEILREEEINNRQGLQWLGASFHA